MSISNKAVLFSWAKEEKTAGNISAKNVKIFFIAG
jgi:hypothetical protein